MFQAIKSPQHMCTKACWKPAYLLDVLKYLRINFLLSYLLHYFLLERYSKTCLNNVSIVVCLLLLFGGRVGEVLFLLFRWYHTNGNVPLDLGIGVVKMRHLNYIWSFLPVILWVLGHGFVFIKLFFIEITCSPRVW